MGLLRRALAGALLLLLGWGAGSSAHGSRATTAVVPVAESVEEAQLVAGLRNGTYDTGWD